MEAEPRQPGALEEALVEAILERYLHDHEVVAVGTSHQAEVFCRVLARKIHEEERDLRMVPTSTAQAALLSALKVGVVSLSEREVEFAIEFASEVDHGFNYVKTDTTSLVRDKMIGQSAAELLVIAPKKAYKERLEGPVPFEIAPYAWKRTLVQLDQLGEARIRLNEKGEPLKSESGHYFADVTIDRIHDLEDLHQQAKDIPGVLETGLFLGYADRVLLHNGGVEVKSRIGPELQAGKEETRAPAGP